MPPPFLPPAWLVKLSMYHVCYSLIYMLISISPPLLVLRWHDEKCYDVSRNTVLTKTLYFKLNYEHQTNGLVSNVVQIFSPKPTPYSPPLRNPIQSTALQKINLKHNPSEIRYLIQSRVTRIVAKMKKVPNIYGTYKCFVLDHSYNYFKFVFWNHGNLFSFIYLNRCYLYDNCILICRRALCNNDNICNIFI